MNSLVKIENLSYQYAESNRKALSDIDLEINAGEWISLVGRNGSGKSTLARLIDGLLEPGQGKIWIDGLPLNEDRIWDIRSKIGMVFQNPDNQFVGATVEDDVAFGLENQGVPRDEMIQRVTGALKQVDMEAFRKKEPNRLSGGQKQRVALAGVIAMTPKILILDEATSMLDPEGRREVLETIQKMKSLYQLTIISITHDIDEVILSDRMIVLQDGQKVMEGTPEELFVQHGQELIKRGLEVPFTEQLKGKLQESGISVPDIYMTFEGMADWLCKLNSTM